MISICFQLTEKSQQHHKPLQEENNRECKGFNECQAFPRGFTKEFNFSFPPRETQRLTKSWRNRTETWAQDALCLSQGCRVGGGEAEEGKDREGWWWWLFCGSSSARMGKEPGELCYSKKPVLSAVPGCACMTSICLAPLVGRGSQIQVFLENSKIYEEESLPKETSGTNK